MNIKKVIYLNVRLDLVVEEKNKIFVHFRKYFNVYYLNVICIICELFKKIINLLVEAIKKVSWATGWTTLIMVLVIQITNTRSG